MASGDVGACAPKCSVSGNECSGGTTCQGLGSFGVNVCAADPGAKSESNPPKPSEQPRVACKTDADCAPVDPRAICAQWQGRRDCTIDCTAQDVCTEGTVGGVTADLESCQTDEGNPARKACLPRAECEDKPLDCVSIGGASSGIPGGSSGIPGGSSGIPGGSSGFPGEM